MIPAWPSEWDASFRLLARGGFEVTSAMQGGEVQFVEIRSRLGERCRLRNPWGEAQAEVTYTSGASELVSGRVLRIPVAAGQSVRIRVAT